MAEATAAMRPYILNPYGICRLLKLIFCSVPLQLQWTEKFNSLTEEKHNGYICSSRSFSRHHHHDQQTTNRIYGFDSIPKYDDEGRHGTRERLGDSTNSPQEETSGSRSVPYLPEEVSSVCTCLLTNARVGKQKYSFNRL